jgi:hypothetical protein
MQSHDELSALARKLSSLAEDADKPEFEAPLKALDEAAKTVEKAFSGSWLGYHSRVYFYGFQSPRPGAHFSQEWGLMDDYGIRGTSEYWAELKPEEVSEYIEDLAGHPDLSTPRNIAKKAKSEFNTIKMDFDSIIETELADHSDKFLEKMRGEIDQLAPLSISKIIDFLSPKTQFMTRDAAAMGQGILVPPHVFPIAEVMSLRQTIDVCRKGADKIAKIASHLERQNQRKRVSSRIGTNVFIGHGRSRIWRELKDFVSDRLSLPWDEFNRVPVAGVTNIARLSEMMDAAAIAFLVMTAEDEMADGGLQARMNVIHEAGLFQGRLGFTKAVVLIEEDCMEFSNIQGLGHIKFPKGNISACFEDVRLVLEREGIIDV